MRYIKVEVSDENGEMIRKIRKKFKLKNDKLIPYAIRFADANGQTFKEWVKSWEEGM
jgi:hypothetical protein